ncbi:beta-tubulin cofactor d [Colletotrichum phormii]|uniref:Beta-tubulin cofactor d n=1 Tax=Colletotrichum phormii TaxID=359342 RepID=A0AAI9ZZB7_9PEZI|nr:beta-tubulin cofactor d [Colletotrichum phormii]KAK1640963.1 beta-tubulin cofactor d [Colletotrichum phormii]
MDAHEDDSDIKLQKASSELIAEFSRSLPLFLRKPDGKTLRARVRVSETSRLTSSLLDPFQELPQLLDPHLPEWLPLLASTYLEHLNTRTRTRARPSASTRSQLLEPLSLAIAKIIYHFTKIRGEKVIVRFLNVESRHIEPLLSALEASERASSTARPALNPLSSPQSATASSSATPVGTAQWSWEERYLVLLWLSHLLLAPFDLSTISSASAEPDLTLPSIPDFDWPEDLPGITVRILPIAIKYLASSGKERDGARALLVRVAMRRDMQSQGVLSALVRWSLASLKPSPSPSPSSSDATTPASSPQPPYFYIGVLSFLAGVLRSSINTSDMDAYLSSIFLTAHAVASAEDASDTTAAAAPSVSAAIRSVAVARKMLIKVIRSVTVLLLRSNKSPSDHQSTDELVEMSIGYLLESLADNDTPVRLAASKALSIVTLKLDPDMASQVVDAVLDSLNRNVFWTRDPGTSKGTSSSATTTTSTRDLTAVDPLEWHGLMLTLSHLLYRRSPPASQLPSIVHGLLLGLSFEKRSTSGGSIGTNVRDAACFGIWALARRYTTPELLHVPTASVVAARSYHQTSSTSSNASSNVSASSVSILQVLATELTVTASLDPAGNIRRGASAALQELIGRHPDTVEKGIWVVQAVDYHTVALRSRAVHDVALSATKLSSQYGAALLDGLLGWRGIGDADVVSRRVAGASFGTLTLELARQTTASASASAASSSTSPSSESSDDNDDGSVAQFTASIERVLARLRTLQTRQVDERHGLVLCLASVLDKFPELLAGKPIDTVITEIAHRIIRELESLFTEFQTTTYRRPELIAEAYSRLITSSFPVLQATSSPSSQTTNLEPGYKVVSTDNTKSLIAAIKTLDAQDNNNNNNNNNKIPDSIANLVSTFHPIVSAGLARTEKEAVAASSEAALVLLVFSPAEERKRIVTEWAGAVRQRPTSRAASDTGTLFALTMSYAVTTTFGGDDRNSSSSCCVVCDTILARWATDNDIDTRVAILQALSQSGLLRDQALVFLDLLAEGLNDYTTNARGDVGSHVRLEALKATKSLWTMALSVDRERTNKMDWLPEAVSKLFLRILRLAAEKLDRVRTEAHAVLALTVESSFATTFTKLTFSSKPYFQTLLNLYATDNSLRPPIAEPARADAGAWMAELLAGYVTSADTGNEDLVIASRAALADFCAASPRNLDAVCVALVSNVKTRQQQQTPGQGQGQGDRVVVPTLEIVAFLCHVGLFQQCREVDLRHLCLQVQKAGYKTGNVRKLEACIKVYGCVAGFDEECAGVKEEEEEILRGKRRDGISEARKRLGALMFHPWPRVRSLVVDELWKLFGEEGENGGGAESLKSVDWSKADKASINRVVDRFALSRAA